MDHLTQHWGSLSNASATQRGPIIFYPAQDGRGKWHAAGGVDGSENTLCESSALLDRRSGNSVHVSPGQVRVHPVVCKKCLSRGGWRPPT